MRRTRATGRHRRRHRRRRAGVPAHPRGARLPRPSTLRLMASAALGGQDRIDVAAPSTSPWRTWRKPTSRAWTSPSSPRAPASRAEHAGRAAAAGALVVDNSSAFRMDPDVPLVVPQVNAHVPHAYAHTGIIANPNCSTIILLMVLAPLERRCASGASSSRPTRPSPAPGAPALPSSRRRPRPSARGEPPEAVGLPAPDPRQRDPLRPGLPTTTTSPPRSGRWCAETRRILDRPDLAVSATCVRVPVEAGPTARP